METQIMLDAARAVANKLPNELTQADKDAIKAMTAECGLKFKPRSACKNCYIDAAVEVFKFCKNKLKSETKTERVWVLREGVDVVWRGIRINAATIDDAKAEQYIKSGFPRKFFL